jgi:hypothetical protein
MLKRLRPKPTITMAYNEYNLHYLRGKGFEWKKTEGKYEIFSDGTCIVRLEKV